MASQVVAIGAALLVVAYVLYRAALPRPIPGIPYNKHAAARLLGDLPDAMKSYKQNQELLSWISSQCSKLDSPVIQLFMRPMKKPWVILDDFRESQDVMARRTPREFDRSEFASDQFAAIAPNSQGVLPTNDAWKANRKLLGDLMNNKFQNEIAAPRTYHSVLQLVQLWRTKIRLAEERAFDVKDDLRTLGIDDALDITFGSGLSLTGSHNSYLNTIQPPQRPQDPDSPVVFPNAALPSLYSSLTTFMSVVGLSHSSPAPRIHQRLVLTFHPKYRKARLEKEHFIQTKLDESWRRLHNNSDKEPRLGCAADVVAQRELTTASKEGRRAQYDSVAIKDELFGLVFAGYDTSIASISWLLKYLTANQDVQSKLRMALRSQFNQAYDAGKNPSVQEIVGANIPYLDAVIEEGGRIRHVGGSLVRMAVVDTELLGFHIPKGTDVFLV
jgi:hypothetical protein